MSGMLLAVPHRDVSDIVSDERAEDSERTCAILRTRRDGSPLDVAGAARAQLLGWARRGVGPDAFVTAGRLLAEHGDAALLHVVDLNASAKLQRRVAELLATAGCTLAPGSRQTMMEV